MAHGEDIRRKVRADFVFNQLGLEVAAVKHGIPPATAKRWKRDAKELGDDWDKARGAQMIAGGGIEDVVRQTLAIVVTQVQATMQQLQDAPDMPPADKVKMLASLSDSYSKMMSVMTRLMPETDKLAVATDVLKRLAEYMRNNAPDQVANYAELLGPFAEELAMAYGK